MFGGRRLPVLDDRSGSDYCVRCGKPIPDEEADIVYVRRISGDGEPYAARYAIRDGRGRAFLPLHGRCFRRKQA
jgi:hypothetical protein